MLSRSFRPAAFFALTLLSSLTIATELCPMPLGVQIAIQASQQAIEARNLGKNKNELLAGIAKDDEKSWIRVILLEMVDEVYDFPPLSNDVYSAYRFEKCLILNRDDVGFEKIIYKNVYPYLEKCQLLSGKKERSTCAMKALHISSGIPE